MDSEGNVRLLPGITATGGSTYRLGYGEWLLTVPAGMSVRFDYLARAHERTFAVFTDVRSGSEIGFDVTSGVTEQYRVVRGDAQATTALDLDALARGFTRRAE